VLVGLGAGLVLYAKELGETAPATPAPQSKAALPAEGGDAIALPK
jgi:hypothetical protein